MQDREDKQHHSFQKNGEESNMYKLNDPSLFETRAFINGAWLQTEKTFPVFNPATCEKIADVTDLAIADVTHAINSAYAAQPTWAAKTGKERGAILRKWYELLIENADDLAVILTSEMGKPFAEAKDEILYGASYIEWFAEEAKRVYGDFIPGHARNKRIVTIKQPVGVVGSITPWNFPNAMIARKVAPALAVGCTFVARPAELTPLSALAMAVLGERAGIPCGVFNVIPCSDASGAGKEICANTKVAKITFTGSTGIGKILMQQAASTVKRVSLELGGNAPFIVFDDADLDAAVEGAVVAKFRNSGQTCVCVNRFYVQSGVYDAFSRKLAERVADFKTGDGFFDEVSVGPLINIAALEKVEAHLSDAISKGANVLTGGKRHSLGGTFFEPTVVAGMRPDMVVSYEETFGPIAPIFKFNTENEVIALANDTELGLAGYFYSNDAQRVWRVAERLETGMVGINTGSISTEIAPFGGIKQSGQGREGSKYGTDDYLEIKYMCFGEID